MPTVNCEPVNCESVMHDVRTWAGDACLRLGFPTHNFRGQRGDAHLARCLHFSHVFAEQGDLYGACKVRHTVFKREPQ